MEYFNRHKDLFDPSMLNKQFTQLTSVIADAAFEKPEEVTDLRDEGDVAEEEGKEGGSDWGAKWLSWGDTTENEKSAMDLELEGVDENYIDRSAETTMPPSDDDATFAYHSQSANPSGSMNMDVHFRRELALSHDHAPLSAPPLSLPPSSPDEWVDLDLSSEVTGGLHRKGEEKEKNVASERKEKTELKENKVEEFHEEWGGWGEEEEEEEREDEGKGDLKAKRDEFVLDERPVKHLPTSDVKVREKEEI